VFSLKSLGDLFGGMRILFINHVAGEDCYCRPIPPPPLPPTPRGPTIAVRLCRCVQPPVVSHVVW